MIAWEPAINKVDARAIEDLEPDAAEDLLEECYFAKNRSSGSGQIVGWKRTDDYQFALIISRNTPKIEARLITELDPDWIKPRLYGTSAIKDAKIILNTIRNHGCSHDVNGQGRDGRDPMVG